MVPYLVVVKLNERKGVMVTVGALCSLRRHFNWESVHFRVLETKYLKSSFCDVNEKKEVIRNI